MTTDDEAKILVLIQAAQANSRGYADFFGWATDRDLEEWGVISALAESLHADGVSFFSEVKARGRPNDPPDCEALSPNGSRIAIEVTELLDGEAIRAFKEGRIYDWAEWSKDKFLSVLAERVAAKDQRFPDLKEPPYDGGYIVVVHTDEPELSRPTVEGFLNGHRLARPTYIARAFLILSYDPTIGRYPYFELTFNG